MSLARSVRNKVRGLFQAYGTAKVKCHLWDSEFAHGRWSCLESTADDLVYAVIEGAARGGSILDLGCGSGNTAGEINEDGYSEYTGVDISKVAIEKAKRRSGELGRETKNRFYQSDISTYEPIQRFNVILLRDSVYYIPRNRIKAVLDRYAGYLKDGGVFVVRMWSTAGKYRGIVDLLERNYELIERRFSDTAAEVMVLRPRWMAVAVRSMDGIGSLSIAEASRTQQEATLTVPVA
jgi:SAM-dependent methyltransferase